MIKNNKPKQLKVYKLHYTVILSKSLNGLKWISSLLNRGKRKPEVYFLWDAMTSKKQMENGSFNIQ